jgi:hypothetical protein
MKCLSLTQPWASLVATGAKKIETRSWRTDYRGPLAIHASAEFPTHIRLLCFTEPFYGALKKANLNANHRPEKVLPLGAILAVGELADVQLITPANAPGEPERSFGSYSPGRFMWLLENVRRLPHPIPAKGSLGLWETDLVDVKDGDIVVR